MPESGPLGFVRGAHSNARPYRDSGGMRVDSAEAELAGDQEDDGAYGGDSREAACPTLCRLEQTVERFEEAVGLARLRPGDDALEVIADHGGDLFHRFNLRAHDAGAPMSEQGAHDVDLLAIEDLAQLFLVGPGASGTDRRHVRDQGIQIRRSRRREPRAVLQERPAHALVVEWASLHKDELMKNWDRCQVPAPAVPIDPLE